MLDSKNAPNQLAFLFENGILTSIQPYYGRLVKEVKNTWKEYGADHVICTSIIPDKKLMQITAYNHEHQKWEASERTTKSIIDHDEIIPDPKLAKLHLVTHTEHSRVYFIHQDGTVKKSETPINLADPLNRKTYLTPDVTHYRTVFFQTFYVKRHNYVRWLMMYRDSIRVDDSFVKGKTHSYGFKQNHWNIPSGTILPPPGDYEKNMLPFPKPF